MAANDNRRKDTAKVVVIIIPITTATKCACGPRCVCVCVCKHRHVLRIRTYTGKRFACHTSSKDISHKQQTDSIGDDGFVSCIV